MKNKEKVVLITGGSGLVGSAIKALQSNYPNFFFYFPSSQLYNLTEQSDVRNMFDKLMPDYVVHCAAKVGGIQLNLNEPAEQFTQNILMNTFMIDEAHRIGVKKFIAFSSVCALPDLPDGYSADENYLHLGPPPTPHYSYAMAKRMVDVQLEAYKKQYGFQGCSIIPTNIFGPNDNYNLINGHVVPCLIHKFHNAWKDRTEVEIWGDGSPKREFIYSQDLAKICLDLLSKDEEMPQRLIIPGQEYSIKEIVDKIKQIYDFDVYKRPDDIWNINVNYNTSKPNGQMRRKTESLYFNELFPNFEYTDINLALKESVKWFNLNFPNVRL